MSLKGGSNYKGAAKKNSDHCGDTVFLRLTFKVTLLEAESVGINNIQINQN